MVTGHARAHRAWRAGVVALAVFAVGIVPVTPEVRASADEPIEPPPEAAEDADYEAELADSLAEGSVEVAFGASGRAGAGPHRRRRLRLTADSLQASVRDEDDTLAGGSIETRAGSGALGAGRLAPRWGLGLLLGAAEEPWRSAPLDRGPRALFRGRSGEGLWWSHGGDTPVHLMAGRFSRRTLAAASTTVSGVGFAALGTRAGDVQGSVFVEREGGGVEAAFDRAGRWRAESVLMRARGRWRLDARVRGGLDGFRSLAEPRRSGPSRALVTGGTWHGGRTHVRLLGALWRFSPGVGGARVMTEARLDVGARGRVFVGVEEQHGVRRAPARPPSQPAGMRQGVWAEWRDGQEPIGLRLRHEVWGAGAWARRTVRSVTAVGVEVALARGVAMRVVHTVFNTRGGERIYLPEAESDRLVLRAARGAGERTRLEARAPFGRGHLGGTLGLAAGAGAPRARWTVEWSKRSRVRRGG